MTGPRTTPDQWRAAADTLRAHAEQWDEKATHGYPVGDLRTQVADILGLEESPDGEPFYLLTHDEDGEVIEGADYSEEVEQLAAMIEGALAMHQVQFDRANRFDAQLATVRELVDGHATDLARRIREAMGIS